jgi:nicotinate-nucleotide pyrophosphorylase (carboxylating)
MNVIKEKKDIRDEIFKNIQGKTFKANICVNESGVIVGLDKAIEKSKKIGLESYKLVKVGQEVKRNTPILKVYGTPKKLTIGENYFLGTIGKYSGIATAAKRAKRLSSNNFKIVCGGWKKMPYKLKKSIRQAIIVGGIRPRICEDPFIYLDKNYVRMYGGITNILKAVRKIERIKVIQIKGEFNKIEKEVIEAATNGADIIMIDTGKVNDCKTASRVLKENNLRKNRKIAFGSNIKLEDIPKLKNYDIDIIDIGRAIIDAPLLDLSFDVIQ